MFFKRVAFWLKVGEMDVGRRNRSRRTGNILLLTLYKFEMCIQRCMAIVTDGTACWVWNCEQDEPKFPHVLIVLISKEIYMSVFLAHSEQVLMWLIYHLYLDCTLSMSSTPNIHVWYLIETVN